MPRVYSRNVCDDVELFFGGGDIPIRCQGQAYKRDHEDEEFSLRDNMEWEFNQSDIMELADWCYNSMTEDEKIQNFGCSLDEDEMREYLTDWAGREINEEWERLLRKGEIDWKPRWK